MQKVRGEPGKEPGRKRVNAESAWRAGERARQEARECRKCVVNRVKSSPGSAWGQKLFEQQKEEKSVKCRDRDCVELECVHCRNRMNGEEWDYG